VTDGMTTARSPKVLHCVEWMNTNAIESWLVRMLRHASVAGRPVDWRFHVQIDRPGALEDNFPECRPLIVRSPCGLSDWRRFFTTFARVCRAGKFDVVHIHGDLMSAPYLVAARVMGVPRAVVHVHNADENIPVGRPFKRRVLQALFRRICLVLADRIVGISNHTLDTFLAGRERRPGRDSVHYYGVDPGRFERAGRNREAFRRAVGLAGDATIVLFAGRMVREKNPLFAVEVLAELHRLDPSIAGVFVGAGGLDEAVRQRAEVLGLGAAFRHLGWRTDLPEIMSCCDCFLLPHPDRPMEGFGLAVVEAQLAGLRMMISEGIADDPLLPTASFRRLPLSVGPRAWADATLDLLRSPAPSPTAARAALRDSPMDMDRALHGLLGLHS
jgi:glycosyltransferase involved in cell wall biosynthesis